LIAVEIAGLGLVAAAGLLALPWTAAELAEVDAACAALGEVVLTAWGLVKVCR
jgi:hypothetical protein